MASMSILLLLVALADAGNVLVKFNEGTVVDEKVNQLKARRATVRYTIRHLFPGVILEKPTSQELDLLYADADVESIEDDVTFQVRDGLGNGQNVFLPLSLSDDPMVSPDEVQSAPSNWGLDRIDSRNGLDNAYNYEYTGSGVNIFVVDSGINVDHVDFGDRVVNACFTAFLDEGCFDLSGRGTHAAGIAAGTFSGVAKEATLINVKVLDANNTGTATGIIAALEWINAYRLLFLVVRTVPSVVSLSIDLGGAFELVNNAVSRMVRRNFVVVVPAGDGNKDACGVTPASVRRTITVGSTTENDDRSDFSNTGECVDIFAPGSDIASSSHTGNSIATIRSGTSMASSHVAGVAALYLHANRGWSAKDVREAILAAATVDAIDGVGSSPNLLVYTGSIEAEPRCGCSFWQIFCLLGCRFIGD